MLEISRSAFLTVFEVATLFASVVVHGALFAALVCLTGVGTNRVYALLIV